MENVLGNGLREELAVGRLILAGLLRSGTKKAKRSTQLSAVAAAASKLRQEMETSRVIVSGVSPQRMTARKLDRSRRGRIVQIASARSEQ